MMKVKLILLAQGRWPDAWFRSCDFSFLRLSFPGCGGFAAKVRGPCCVDGLFMLGSAGTASSEGKSLAFFEALYSGLSIWAAGDSAVPGLNMDQRSSRALRCCPCGRRLRLLGTTAASKSSGAGPSDPEAMVEKFHPRRPGWYEELYAKMAKNCTKSYEAKVAGYKEKLFSQLTGKSKEILELGVGTGANFKYYASAVDINVIGVDPNKKMEKYAQAAAIAAGLPLSNFSFMRGVGEVLPVGDETMDAVIATLVLCSVKNVDMSLREIKRVLKPGGLFIFIEHVAAHDGSFLRFMQRIFDPLQQFIADGCHLHRETGKLILESGFSSVDLNITVLSSNGLLAPQVYGIARK